MSPRESISELAQEIEVGLRERSDLAQLFNSLQYQILEGGGCYHYNHNRAGRLGHIERTILAKLPYRQTTCGVSVPVTCSVLPVFLARERVFELIRLGQILQELQCFQSHLIAKYQDIEERLALDTECALESTFPRTLNRLPWSRVDFLIERNTAKLYVVDINLLPGGIYFTHAITQAWLATFGFLLPRAHGLSTYHIDSWWEHWTKDDSHRPRTAELPVWISAKSDHGLWAEHKGLARCFPSSISGFSPPGTLPNSKLRVIRGFRLKSLAGHELNHVRELLEQGTQFYPSFDLHLGDHQWGFYIRRHREELASFIGPENSEWLLSRIPRTYLLTRHGDQIVATAPERDEPEFVLDDSTLRGFVIKEGGSTGGRGVIIVEKNGGQRNRKSALESLERLGAQLNGILQEFIMPSKFCGYGFGSGVRQEWKNEPTKYSAFYCGGKFVGGIAVQRPSHKIYGSLSSGNIPLFWRADDERAAIAALNQTAARETV